MKYRTANSDELNALLNRIAELVGKDAVIDLKIHRPKRSSQQNRLMWLLFHSLSEQTGFEVGEVKQTFEREINPDIFLYESRGKEFCKSTTDLTTKEMTTALDRLYRYAAEAGYPLPVPYNEDDMINLENRYEN